MNKKLLVFFGTGVLSLSLFSLFALRNNIVNKVEAVNTTTDMDNVDPITGQELDIESMFFDGFDYGINTEDWSAIDQKWGNEFNSGVRHENVFYNGDEGSVSFRALGGQYTEGEITNDNDSAYTQDGTYTGGVLATNFGVGPGRFEARMRIPAIKGACYALWTYNYGENYNEIDIELPVREEENKTAVYRFDKILCTTYTAQDSSTSESSGVLSNLADGEYHTFAFDWYRSDREGTTRVDWFVDGARVKTSYTNVSQYSARIWVGVWVPNNQYFVGASDFDKAYMDVDYVKYTPFKNQDYVDLHQGKDTHGTNQYGGDYVVSDRNYLPNDKFDNNTLNGYVSGENAELSTEYNYSDNPSSYGVKVSPYELTYEIYLRGEDNMKFSADYRGYGEISLKFFNPTNTLGNTGLINLVNGNFSRNDYVHASSDVVVPASAYLAKITVYTESSDFGIFVDNLFFGQHIEFEENQAGLLNKDSYSASSYLYKDASIEGWGAHDVNFGGDNKIWHVVAGNYYNDDLALSNTNAIATAESGVAGAINDCMVANDLFNLEDGTGRKLGVSAIYQDFDVNYFKDIEFGFKSFVAYNSWRIVSILYSTDGGQTYSLLKTSRASNCPETSDSLFKYSLKATKDDLSISFTKIRFAFVGTNDTEDSYLLTSIVINNNINLMQKLDSDGTCSYNNMQRTFLARQYSALSNDEKALLNTNIMTNYNQTYEQGYQYLQTYWGLGGNSSGISNLVVSDSNNSLIFIVVATSLIAASLAFVFIRRKQK